MHRTIPFVWVASFALIVLLVGCSSKGRPISSHASWIFNATEFEVFQLDPLNELSLVQKTTEPIGINDAGANLLRRETVSGEQAKAVLAALRKAEERDYFTKPVELAQLGEVVLRFKKDGVVYDLSTDRWAHYFVLYRDGQWVASVVYKDPAPSLTTSLGLEF